MTMVKVGENESLDSALKRFKRKCQRDGIIGDIRKKEAYLKPSVKRKRKVKPQEHAQENAAKNKFIRKSKLKCLRFFVSFKFP